MRCSHVVNFNSFAFTATLENIHQSPTIEK